MSESIIRPNDELDQEKLTNQQIMVILSSIITNLRSIEERIDCLQHTLCKNNDEKTHDAIRKFLKSNFRNG